MKKCKNCGKKIEYRINNKKTKKFCCALCGYEYYHPKKEEDQYWEEYK